MVSKAPTFPEIEKDFADLLRLFNEHKVDYCIVGAYAVGFHAISRYTKDMDLLVRPDLENGKRIVEALKDFGFGKMPFAPDDFASEKTIVQLGYPPVRIDLITSVQGCRFEQVWKNRKRGSYGPLTVYFIGLKDLIRNKTKVARPQDLVDLKILKKALRKSD